MAENDGNATIGAGSPTHPRRFLPEALSTALHVSSVSASMAQQLSRGQKIYESRHA